MDLVCDTPQCHYRLQPGDQFPKMFLCAAACYLMHRGVTLLCNAFGTLDHTHSSQKKLVRAIRCYNCLHTSRLSYSIVLSLSPANAQQSQGHPGGHDA